MLLRATDALDGQKTRDKIAQDDRSVSELNEACSPLKLLDALATAVVIPSNSSRLKPLKGERRLVSRLY